MKKMRRSITKSYHGNQFQYQSKSMPTRLTQAMPQPYIDRRPTTRHCASSTVPSANSLKPDLPNWAIICSSSEIISSASKVALLIFLLRSLFTASFDPKPF